MPRLPKTKPSLTIDEVRGRADALRRLAIAYSNAKGTVKLPSIRKFCEERKINRIAFTRHLVRIKDARAIGHTKVEVLKVSKGGRRPYLSAKGVEMLDLYGQSMDRCGFPIAPTKLKEAIRDIKCHLEGIEDSATVKMPSSTTLTKIRRQLSVPCVSVSEGHGGRKLKSKEHFLMETYALMRKLCEKYNYKPCDMYGASPLYAFTMI